MLTFSSIRSLRLDLGLIAGLGRGSCSDSDHSGGTSSGSASSCLLIRILQQEETVNCKVKGDLNQRLQVAPAVTHDDHPELVSQVLHLVDLNKRPG